MKEIKLTNSTKVVLIDDEDFERITSYGVWALNTGYAMFGNSRNGYVLMHKLLCPCSDDYEVDHKDGNKLNNQKSNLRACTRSQNIANAKTPSNNTSGHKGITKYRDKWRVQIGVKGKRIHVGIFVDKERAIEAYKKAATQHFGEFAYGQ